MSLYAQTNEDEQRPATSPATGQENPGASLDVALESLGRFLDAVGPYLDGLEAGIVVQVDRDRANALYDAWEEAQECAREKARSNHG